MIIVYKHIRDEMKKGSVNDIHPLQKLLWIAISDPTEEDLDTVEQKAKIPKTAFINALDQNEPASANTAAGFTKLILKSSPADKTNLKSDTMCVIFNRDYVITLSKNYLPALKKLEKKISNDEKNDILIESSDVFVYEIIKCVFIEFEKTLDDIDERIDGIEDKILKMPKKQEVKDIFSLKKKLIYLHKALSSNKEVVSMLDRGQIPHIEKKNVLWFRELYYDINQLIDMETTYRDMITGSLELYASSISNAINETMKKLTVVASFVLVPTLIAGIYGMNFQVMPEISWKWGYPFALGLMAFSVLGMYAYFKAKNWL